MNKLILFNAALRHVGEGKLASLSENREPRRLLDQQIEEGAIKHCLGQADWKFAIRTSKLTYSPSLVTEFGYRYVFEQPEDFVKTSALCTDEYFKSPLLHYSFKNELFYAGIEDIFIEYVSDDASFGMDYEKWPPAFTQYVACYLAQGICIRLTQSEEKFNNLIKLTKYLLREAKSDDAMEGPTKFLPSGSWVRSRGNSFSEKK
jgi:hypothetical protein